MSHFLFAGSSSAGQISVIFQKRAVEGTGTFLSWLPDLVITHQGRHTGYTFERFCDAVVKHVLENSDADEWSPRFGTREAALRDALRDLRFELRTQYPNVYVQFDGQFGLVSAG